MKKTLPVIFAFLILFNAGGFFLVFKSMQYQVKREIKSLIKAELPESELTKIKVSTKDAESGSSGFKWYEEGKEFSLKGKMYDVVRRKTDGDSIIYYCINDTKEEQLFSNLNGFMSKTMSNDAARNRVLKIAFRLSQSFYDYMSKNTIVWQDQFKILNYSYSAKELFIAYEVPVPPPKKTA